MNKAEKKEKQKFIVSVAFRYTGLVFAFVLSVLVAAYFLPYAVVLNPVFQFCMWVAAVLSIFVYVMRSMQQGPRATGSSFLQEKGFYEILVGGTVGLAVAGELIVSAAVAPGAILFAATTVVALFISMIAYVAVNQMLLSSRELEKEISATQKAGSGLLFLGFIFGLPVVGLLIVSGVAGVSLLPFLFEITLAGLSGLMLLGNVFTVLHKQEVVVWGERRSITVQDNPMYCTVLLFANTLELFRALVQAYMHLSNSKKDSDKVKISWKDVCDTLVGVTIVAGVFFMIYQAFKGTFCEPVDTGEHRYPGSTEHQGSRSSEHFDNGSTSPAWSTGSRSGSDFLKSTNGVR